MKEQLMVLLAVAALLLAAGTVSAATENYKLIDSDTFGGENFGNAVDVDGNTAVIGAQWDDDAGVGSGSAYVFHLDTMGGTELFKLTATDAAAGDYFGNAVAVSGNVAIVGAYGDDDAGSGSGSAYLFDVTTGTELFKLTASDAFAGDAFGFSVAISGNRAIVGSYYDDDAGLSSGSAYIFDVTTGTELYKLTASDATAGAKFGTSVAIDGNFAAVGAPMEGAWLEGKAYLYCVGPGVEMGILQASDIANFAFFGSDVAIDGDTLVVGSEGSKNGGASYTGSAYVYDVLTQTELTKLAASDQAGYDWFGRTVDIDGDLIVVGAPDNDDGGSKSGSAYFFDSTTYAELDKLTASDAAADDRFGNKVGISGGNTIVGINQFKADVNGAYVYVTALTAVPGDFDSDTDVDDEDIDMLCDFIRLGLAYDEKYDISADGTSGGTDGSVDLLDLAYHVRSLVETAVGNGTEYGDFNLDGMVDTTDLTRLATNYGDDDWKWDDGNANRYIDTNIDNTDLTILATYYGFGEPDIVPGPATLFVMGCGAAGILRRRRRA